MRINANEIRLITNETNIHQRPKDNLCIQLQTVQSVFNECSSKPDKCPPKDKDVNKYRWFSLFRAFCVLCNKMTDTTVCAGCQRDGENTRAGSWCSDCGELVCNPCAKFHKKLFLLTRLYQSNGQHDCVLCDSCMSESHESCKPIVSIEKAAKGVKNGAAVFDLESRMENLCQVVKKTLRNQKRYKKQFHQSRNEIRTQISEIKTRVIEQINKIEEALIKDLDKQYTEHEDTFIDRESNLQSMLELVSSCLADFKSLKPHATEIHLFQAVKYLDAKTCKQEVEARKIHTTFLKLEFQPEIGFTNLMKSFPSFGTVNVTEEPMKLSAELDIDQQGQALVRPIRSQRKLSLFTSFKTTKLGKDVYIRSGCFIPSNRLLLPNYNDDKIHICQLDGSNSSSIKLRYNPYAVSLYDYFQAIVTSNHREFIEIIDIENLKAGKNIQVGLECKGITSVGGNICVRDSFSSLSMIDIDGIELRKTSTTSDPLCLSLNKANEIYYTAVSDDNVYVIKSDGKERVFYKNPGLKDPYGIAVDDNNDVYVAGRKSNAIYRISEDGQKQDIVLNEKDARSHDEHDQFIRDFKPDDSGMNGNDSEISHSTNKSMVYNIDMVVHKSPANDLSNDFKTTGQIKSNTETVPTLQSSITCDLKQFKGDQNIKTEGLCKYRIHNALVDTYRDQQYEITVLNDLIKGK
ncbi:unnamed protein product [Mytilus coruscus]|uniref:B box-type domain-containing protein n=1 Tax=Mytilus coruscus TaxID=42192 RepID=A0A6J8F188_MYTCO|nr:unnamed protein product [Mytilus coruscus]